MSDELKPVKCGCGGEVAVLWNEYYRVKCWKCGTQTKRSKTKAEAIEAWNTAMKGLLPEGDPQKNVGVAITNSTEPERKSGRWTGDCCSCCGVSKYNYIKMVDDECGPFGTWNFCPNCGAEMTRGEDGKA